LITTTNKAEDRKGKVLVINAVKEVKQEKNIAYLEQKNIEKIYTTYKDFSEAKGFSKVVAVQQILENKGSLNIAQYVSNVDSSVDKISVEEALRNWHTESDKLKQSMHELFQILD